MKILFVMRSTVYVRNFESTLRLLAERGHRVHVVADAHQFLDPTDMIGRLVDECPSITCGPPPVRPPNGWVLLGEKLRRGVDYLRYLGSEYQDAPKLRERAGRTAPSFVTALLGWRVVRSRPGRALLSRALRVCDRALPGDPAVDAFLQARMPDLLLVTPLVEPGSPQAAYLRSARGLGIRTGLCVYSWDNLTNKGLIQDPLDIVTVWNEPMKKEAVELHHVAPSRVVVTGAPAYDQWFDWKPRATREAFCARVGLRSDRPYVLYVCSSKFIAPDEVSFVRQWVQRLRESAGVLREVGVLVRPHPQNGDQWKAVDLSDLASLAIWPAAGRNPVDRDSRSDYYDSIYHSAAIVGVNTSAQIESAVVGRRVHTVLAPEFRDTQQGTLHFRHLYDGTDGLLRVARSFPDHLAHLERAIEAPRVADEEARKFVERFVRPFGLAVPATPILVDALEAVAAKPAFRPTATSVSKRLIRRLLASPAASCEREERDLLEADARRDKEKQEKVTALVARRSAKEAEAERTRRERREEVLRRRLEKERKRVARTPPLNQEHESARAAFDRYLLVRQRVCRMKELAAGSDEAASASERRMLSAISHMWDATPDTIASLRHQSAPVAGISERDYANAGEARRRFFHDLHRLRKVGNPDLLVSEAPLLGGFGYVEESPQGEARFFNDETLKFYEVLSALQCGAVLGTFRPHDDRKHVVWEIGGGWGGFAYQFKTLFPNVTYVITAAPQLFLLSAVYLMTAFPQARCRFYGDSAGEEFWHRLHEVDFAFAPEGAVGLGHASSQVDLTVDLMALERMTPERARAHVKGAFDLGSRYLYSLGPSDPSGEAGLTDVSACIAQWYWPHVIPVPQYKGMRVLAGFRGRGPEDGVPRTHRVGWRRILA